MKEPSHEEKWSNAPLDPEQAKPGSSTEKDTTVADWLAGEHPHQTRETGSEFDHNSPVFNSKYPGLHLHYVAHGGKPNAYGLVSQLDKQKVRTLSWEAVLGAPRRIYAKLFNSRADKTPKEQAYIESIQVSEKLVNSMFPLITLESATGSRPENSNQETGGYPAHLVYEFISVLSNYQKQTLGNDNIHIFDVNLYDKTARDWIIRIAEDAREFERNKNYHSCYKWLLEFCKFNEYREKIMRKNLDTYHKNAIQNKQSVGAWVGKAHSLGLTGVSKTSVTYYKDGYTLEGNYLYLAILDYTRNHDIKPTTVVRALESFGLNSEAEEARMANL